MAKGSFWTEERRQVLAAEFERLARAGLSLESLVGTFANQVSMEGIRHGIRRLRSEGKIGHYRDYVTGEEKDLIDGPRMDIIEDGEADPVVDVRSDSRYGPAITTLKQMLDHAREQGMPDDLDRFKITNYRRNKWDVTTSEGQTYSNWQVKATFGLKKPIESLEKVWHEILTDLRQEAPKLIDVRVNPVSVTNGQSYLFEPAIFDLHLGNLIWGEEVGEDWDVHIASQIFEQTLDSLIHKAMTYVEGSGFDEILWIVGNDFLHADGKSAQTSAGTQLALDTRWQKIFRMGRMLQCGAIEKLRSITDKVHVLVVPGNHDELSSFALGEVLAALYDHTEDVEVDNSPPLRKYRRYGNTLLGFTHGSNEKLDRLPLVMATEAREDWGETEFHEFHLGHFHHRKGRRYVDEYEDQGVVLRVLPTVTAADDYHSRLGLVTATRAAEGYLFHEENGLEAVFHSQRRVELKDTRN